MSFGLFGDLSLSLSPLPTQTPPPPPQHIATLNEFLINVGPPISPVLCCVALSCLVVLCRVLSLSYLISCLVLSHSFTPTFRDQGIMKKSRSAVFLTRQCSVVYWGIGSLPLHLNTVNAPASKHATP